MDKQIEDHHKKIQRRYQQNTWIYKRMLVRHSIFYWYWFAFEQNSNEKEKREMAIFPLKFILSCLFRLFSEISRELKCRTKYTMTTEKNSNKKKKKKTPFNDIVPAVTCESRCEYTAVSFALKVNIIINLIILYSVLVHY